MNHNAKPGMAVFRPSKGSEGVTCIRAYTRARNTVQYKRSPRKPSNALGQQRWQMCGIINDTFWFCRSRIQRELAEQGDAIAVQRTSMPTATHRGGGAG
jgi:hypothetical protein